MVRNPWAKKEEAHAWHVHVDVVCEMSTSAQRRYSTIKATRRRLWLAHRTARKRRLPRCWQWGHALSRYFRRRSSKSASRGPGEHNLLHPRRWREDPPQGNTDICRQFSCPRCPTSEPDGDNESGRAELRLEHELSHDCEEAEKGGAPAHPSRHHKLSIGSIAWTHLPHGCGAEWGSALTPSRRGAPSTPRPCPPAQVSRPLLRRGP